MQKHSYDYEPSALVSSVLLVLDDVLLSSTILESVSWLIFKSHWVGSLVIVVFNESSSSSSLSAALFSVPLLSAVPPAVAVTVVNVCVDEAEGECDVSPPPLPFTRDDSELLPLAIAAAGDAGMGTTELLTALLEFVLLDVTDVDMDCVVDTLDDCAAADIAASRRSRFTASTCTKPLRLLLLVTVAELVVMEM